VLHGDVLQKVFSFVKPAEMGSFGAVSKAWNAAASEDVLWQSHAIDDFWNELQFKHVLHDHPWRGIQNWSAEVHEQSVFAQELRARAPHQAVAAYTQGALCHWGVMWRERHHMMITAHRPWEHDHMHHRALAAAFELRMDVLCEASRTPNNGSANLYVTQHMLGSASVCCTGNRGIVGATMLSKFGPGELHSPAGRTLGKGADLGGLHQEIFAGEKCNGRLVLNIFARRRSDGKVAHIFRLVSLNLDEAVQESAASDAHNVATTGNQELFSGRRLFDVGFTCAPPKLDDISPQSLQAGAAWLVNADISSDGAGTIKIDLRSFCFLCRGSLGNDLSLNDVNIRRAQDAREIVRWSDMRELMERPRVIDWMACPRSG
jgi:hypothetical protein